MNNRFLMVVECLFIDNLLPYKPVYSVYCKSEQTYAVLINENLHQLDFKRYTYMLNYIVQVVVFFSDLCLYYNMISCSWGSKILSGLACSLFKLLVLNC